MLHGCAGLGAACSLGFLGVAAFGRGLGLPTELDDEIEPLQADGAGRRGGVIGGRQRPGPVSEPPGPIMPSAAPGRERRPPPRRWGWPTRPARVSASSPARGS